MNDKIFQLMGAAITADSEPEVFDKIIEIGKVFEKLKKVMEEVEKLKDENESLKNKRLEAPGTIRTTMVKLENVIVAFCGLPAKKKNKEILDRMIKEII